MLPYGPMSGGLVRRSVLSVASALVAAASAGAAGCGSSRSAGGADPVPAAAQLPYARFDGVTFEPSAAAYDPGSDRYLVLSDKDAILYRYRLADGKLELPKGEIHRALRLADGAAAMKIEAMTRLGDGAFLAVTAFDRPDADFRRLIRFRFAPRGPVEAAEISFPEAAISARLKVIDPALDWWKIEGLATTADDGAALVAIRSVGKDFRQKRDVAWILRLPRTAGLGYAAPDRVVELGVVAAVGRAEGASSLERDPKDGSYLLLTSWEAGDAAPGDHGGHLFRLPADLLDPRGAVRGAASAPPTHAAATVEPLTRVPLSAPLRTFRAKPDGLAVTPEGRVLVIFDDDTAWKRLFDGYEPSQGLFLAIEPGDLASPARASPSPSPSPATR